jgi:hypothetical protein
MTQPLAILNAEELHWLGDLGLPNQRRWLNHRTLGDEHRRTFPPAAAHSNTRPQTQETTHFFILLTQRELAGAALFVFEAGADFQQAVEHFRAFSASGAELGIGLLMHVLEAVKLVGDV